MAQKLARLMPTRGRYPPTSGRVGWGPYVYCADVAPGTEVLFWGLVSMPIEFLHGRPLSPEELEMLRRQIEEGFDNTADVDDEIRAIVARNWPYLLEKLPPEGE
jgi:hypothetical protein